MMRVAVVGGGITGCVAARALAVHHETHLFEADGRVGGKIRTRPFHGRAAVDEGPDAFLARVPWATTLAHEVGIGGALTSPAAGHAAIWWDRLHTIPGGLVLGVPTGITALARSGLLTTRGTLRAAIEPLVPRTSLAEDSLGAYVRHRFGDEVHERLVDPLVGSIYAADTDRFSLAAVPQLAQLAARRRSVLLGRHAPPQATAGPIFHAPLAGMGALVEAVITAARADGAGVHTGATVAALHRTADATGGRWRLEIAGEAPASAQHAAAAGFDAVVVACPARHAADLLRHAAPDAARGLADIHAADVAIVTVAVDATTWPERVRGLSGYLVPKPRQRLVTAVSFASQKWRHWHDDRSVLLRISLGRDGREVLHHDDAALEAAALDEVGDHLGTTLRPLAIRVTRWPGAFPQYRPHHASHVDRITSAMPTGVVLAGASLHGIGVPACVRSAQQVVAALTAP